MSPTVKTRFAVAAAALLAAGAAPAVAPAATAIPALQPGDTQAYAALAAGGARIAAPISRTFSGNLTLTTGALQVTCTANLNVGIAIDGTTQVLNASFSACGTNVGGCNASAVPNNLTWGGRLVRDGAGIYRDRIDVVFTNTLSAGCPVPSGAYTYTGVLSPRLTSGTPASATFDGASGTVTSALGTATVSGTALGAAGQATYFRL